jgi:Domain of unknown function (DUF4326)
MPNIFNKRSDKPPASAILVDRTTRWGNPFKMENEAERDAVCNMFENYAIARANDDSTWLISLRGKDLICWCSPKRCHAETLRRLANA